MALQPYMKLSSLEDIPGETWGMTENILARFLLQSLEQSEVEQLQLEDPNIQTLSRVARCHDSLSLIVEIYLTHFQYLLRYLNNMGFELP